MSEAEMAMTGGRTGPCTTAETARARRDLYSFLAGIFLNAPAAATLDELMRRESLDELASAYGEAAVAELRSLDADAGAVREEFDRLFKVPVAGFVSPCESTYAAVGPGGSRDKPRLWGAACRDVATLMREAGAKLPAGLIEPPDHIGVELLFLGFLCDAEARAAESEERDALGRWHGRQALFLREHPAAWFGTLAAGIRDRAPGGFYAAVSLLVQEILATDLRQLAAR